MKRTTYLIVCDGCGTQRQFLADEQPTQARMRLAQVGWRWRQAGDRIIDHCPTCGAK